MIPLAYATLAILMALEGDELGASLLTSHVSAVSSSSAIALLGAIATGMMALTGLVFSLFFVAIQLGATAYSPRLVRELGLRDPVPHALGVFVGTFLYAGLAIHTVDIAGKPGVNAPVVWTAFGWLVASVVALVVVVRAVSGLTIDRVLHIIGRRGLAAVERADRASTGRGRLGATRLLGPAIQTLLHEGPPRYVRGLDVPSMVRAARRAGGVLIVHRATGDPVLAGDLLASLHHAERAISERPVRRAIDLGGSREIDRDPVFALRLLADIAIRALSPAINDPTTAVTALDAIEALLRALGRSTIDVGRASDEDGVLRLLYEVPSWRDMLSVALSEIQYYGRESVQVERRLGALLRDLEAHVPEPRRAAIRRLALRRDGEIDESFGSGGDWRAEAWPDDPQGLGHGRASTA